MKQTKIILSLVLAALMLLAIVPGMALADGEQSEQTKESVEHGELSFQFPDQVVVGESDTITSDKSYSYELVWTSDNENVLTVKDGVVTGVKAGKATVTVTDKEQPKYKASKTITVITEETYNLNTFNELKKNEKAGLDVLIADNKKSDDYKEHKAAYDAMNKVYTNGKSRLDKLRYDKSHTLDVNMTAVNDLVDEILNDADAAIIGALKKEVTDAVSKAKSKTASENTKEALKEIENRVTTFGDDEPEELKKVVKECLAKIKELTDNEYYIKSVKGTYNNKGKVWVKDSGKKLVITIDDANDTSWSHFSGVTIDGNELTRDVDYTASKGSTVVEIKPSALNRRVIGSHKINIVFDNDTVSKTITIRTSDAPLTGDNSNPVLWISLMAASLLGIAVLAAVFFTRKRRLMAR